MTTGALQCGERPWEGEARTLAEHRVRTEAGGPPRPLELEEQERPSQEPPEGAQACDAMGSDSRSPEVRDNTVLLFQGFCFGVTAYGHQRSDHPTSHGLRARLGRCWPGLDWRGQQVGWW